VVAGMHGHLSYDPRRDLHLEVFDEHRLCQPAMRIRGRSDL
jgi:hypothetical protein